MGEVLEQKESVRAGKYLTFKLGDEEYGLMIMKVKTIIGLMDITEVPRTPEYVRGVINLRGQIIPIVDMRLKFGMPETEDTRETTIIVVEIPKNDSMEEIGVVVDAVSEVLDIPEAEIDDAPSFGGSFDEDFILGMAKTKKSVISLLNVDKILSTSEIVELTKRTSE